MSKCFWGHNWTKWEISAERDIFETDLNTKHKAKKGFYMEQKRTCNDCGFIEFNRDVFTL